MSSIKELIASKLRPVANAVRTKSGKTELIPVDDLEDEILALPDTEALRQSLKQLMERNGTSFDIPYGITKINGTFNGWAELISIIIPESVRSIGANAFMGCSKLTSVKLPNGLEEIGANAFRDCSKLQECAIPNSVKTLGDGCFRQASVREVYIPEGITTIPADAFYNAYIVILKLPKTITVIGKSAFSNITNLTDVYFNKTLKEYMQMDFTSYNTIPIVTGNFYLAENNNEYYLLENLIIPNDVEEIKPYTFSYKGIKTIDFGNVKKINTNAFSYCSNVKSLIIPDSVTEIGANAFMGCSKAEEIYIGGNVVSIGSSVFYNIKNNNIVVVKATTPPSLGSNNFYDTAKIFVPLGTRNAYISATNWSKLASKIFEPNTVSVSIPAQLLNNANYTYSVDGGEMQQFTASSLTLENVATIKIKNLDANTTILIGTSAGGSDIGTIANAELTHATSGNQTIYLTVA